MNDQINSKNVFNLIYLTQDKLQVKRSSKSRQRTMDEENIGNPVDRGWSWVILFGSNFFNIPSKIF